MNIQMIFWRPKDLSSGLDKDNIQVSFTEVAKPGRTVRKKEFYFRHVKSIYIMPV